MPNQNKEQIKINIHSDETNMITKTESECIKRYLPCKQFARSTSRIPVSQHYLSYIGVLSKQSINFVLIPTFSMATWRVNFDRYSVIVESS